MISKKAKLARIRNFEILRLRGAESIKYIICPEDIDEFVKIINRALLAKGAKTVEQSREDWIQKVNSYRYDLRKNKKDHPLLDK